MEKDLSELTTHCIRCGFCLESCPTFVTTASELESPRGRIYLVRSAAEGKLRWEEDVRPHLDRCLGCRNCETACPSGVEYGAILEMARDRIERAKPDRAKQMLLASTTHPGVLRAQLALGKLLPGRRIPNLLSRALSGEDAEADRPSPQKMSTLSPLDESALPPVRGEVYLLEGCAMRVLFPRVHLATRRLLRRVGFRVREVPQGCCGALHAHNGDLAEAEKLALGLAGAMPGDLPVVVNSAGCGSTMKEYADRSFASRVFDAAEFLYEQGLIAELSKSAGLARRVTYHDACHLAHGQRITRAPRELVKAVPGIDFVELPEADMCCGSAGIYNLTQPKMARTLVERKYANVAATGASTVVTGNPGCHAWMAQAAREHGSVVRVVHTMEFLEASFNAQLLSD